MMLKRFVLALAILASTASAVLAQSQPNYGPARNRGSDTYGQPYSGSAAARQESGGW